MVCVRLRCLLGFVLCNEEELARTSPTFYEDLKEMFIKPCYFDK